MEATLNSMHTWPVSTWPRSRTRTAISKPLCCQADNSAKSAPVFSDEQLIESIVGSGNQRHFRMLIARYQNTVHSIALSVPGPGKHSDAVYWGLTTAIMSILLASSSLSSQPDGLAVMPVFLITVVSGFGLAWFIARQSGIGLQSLFARTLL